MASVRLPVAKTIRQQGRSTRKMPGTSSRDRYVPEGAWNVRHCRSTGTGANQKVASLAMRLRRFEKGFIEFLRAPEAR